MIQTDKNGYLDSGRTQKSFNRLAKVEQNGNKFTLISYTTRVAMYDTDSDTLTTYGWYSMTTARHIKEFARQCGFSVGGKKELSGGIKVWHK
jgi:hypothetical protein